MANQPEVMDKLVSLAKRRGFIFPSSEIYGGINSCYDYGPLGVELKRNVKDFWWRSMTRHDNIEGLDASILMHPRVWEASGHVEGFTDPLVDCKQCKNRFREDQVEGKKCPNCGGKTQRLISAGSGVIFKGTGFYDTDYKKKSGKDSSPKPSCPSDCKHCPSNPSTKAQGLTLSKAEGSNTSPKKSKSD